MEYRGKKGIAFFPTKHRKERDTRQLMPKTRAATRAMETNGAVHTPGGSSVDDASSVASSDSSACRDSSATSPQVHHRDLWAIATKRARELLRLRQDGHVGRPVDRHRRNADSARLSRMRNCEYIKLLEQAVLQLKQELRETQAILAEERVKRIKAQRLIVSLSHKLVNTHSPIPAAFSYPNKIHDESSLARTPVQVEELYQSHEDPERFVFREGDTHEQPVWLPPEPVDALLESWLTA